MSTRDILDKAERTLDAPDITERLAGLPTSELTAILLEIARQRAEARGPGDVLRAWASDDYVKRVDTDIRALKRLELALLEAAADFEAVELSPLAPLGSCSTFSTGGQNRVLPAARNLEVLADPTNLLALECAARRRGHQRDIRLCTIARPVRCQPLRAAHHTRHFSLLAAVTAGRHRDSREFAKAHVCEHVRLHQALHEVVLADHPGATSIRLELHATDDYRDVAETLAASQSESIPECSIEPLEGGYYGGLRFQLWSRLGETELPLTDGGLFDWMQTLCSDRKEQLVTSAFACELASRSLPDS